MLSGHQSDSPVAISRRSPHLRLMRRVSATSHKQLHGRLSATITKGLTRACATRGITANAVAQGDIHAAMTVAMADEIVNKPLGTVPVCQLTDPHEIGRRMQLLALGDAGFITGATIAIKGGLQLGSPSAL